MERKTERRDLKMSKMYLLESRGGCSIGDQPVTSRKSGEGAVGGTKDRRQFKRKKVLPLSLHIQHLHLHVICMYICIFFTDCICLYKYRFFSFIMSVSSFL